MILAPLRGVTIRAFRETFADVIVAAGFDEAITPFISAMPGVEPMKDRELAKSSNRRVVESSDFRVTPQFIGKDPVALQHCLESVKAAGYDTADLNCGCPFPMVRNKGRGSGLLRTPDVLRRMLEVGCETMGAGRFSVKARLGVDRNDELLDLMPMINEFPLRFLTVHARNARQMYAGVVDVGALEAVLKVAKVPIVVNGDIPFPPPPHLPHLPNLPNLPNLSNFPNIPLMIGRGFIRYLGMRDDCGGLLQRYLAASQTELSGDRPVLGRLKELIAYWKDLPQWKRRWNVIKTCRSVDELRGCLPSAAGILV